MKVDFIKEQIESVDKWTTNLVSDIEDTDFGVVQPLSTSINWELGHIIVSKYFHTIKSTVSSDSKIFIDINNSIPIDNFFKYYFAGSNPLENWKERPNKNQLLEFKNIVDNTTNIISNNLTEIELNGLTETGNPIAKTKYDAITFAFKHQMWHNGQIAMIKRIIK